MEMAHDEQARAGRAGVSVVAMEDETYPSRLKQIYDPPIVLYVRGAVDLLSRPGIAVVGTRHPTPYGTGMAERLSCDLAARGLVIFSGMARGVDSAAHRGASLRKERRLPSSAPEWTFFTRKRTADCRTRCWRKAEHWSRSFPWVHLRHRRISPSVTGSSAGYLSACWLSKPRSIAGRASLHAAPSSKIAKFLPSLEMSPTRIRGARTRSSSRAPSWLRPGRTFGRNSQWMFDLRSLRLAGDESPAVRQHLYSAKPSSVRMKKRSLAVLKADEATQIG